jgi:tetratricopeptide (TPR) repeat protein
MKAAVDQALELDSTLGEAYATRAWNRLVIDLDFGGPDGDFRRALTLSPGTAWIHHWYADYLTLAGRWEEAIARRRVAMALDPLSAPTSVGLGWTYFKARRYPESIAQLQRTLALAPDYFYAHMELAWNYSQQGMHVSAVAQCDSAIASAPLPEARDPSLCGWVYGRAGQRQRVLTQLRALTSASRQRWVDPFQVAILYVGLGDSDQALEWLRRAVREHAQSLAFLKVEPMLDPLRSDPRFQQLLEDLGIKS